jgi:hypothetical protein
VNRKFVRLHNDTKGFEIDDQNLFEQTMIDVGTYAHASNKAHTQHGVGCLTN